MPINEDNDLVDFFAESDEPLEKPKEEAIEEAVEEVEEKPVKDMAPIYTMPEPEPEPEAVVEEKVEEKVEEPELRGEDVPLAGPLAMFDFSKIDRKYFPNSVLANYTSQDLLSFFKSVEHQYTILRANNSPGKEAEKAKAFATMNELRAILKVVGHSV